MSRHTSIALMRKNAPYQSASHMLAHLYTNLRHLLGNRERGPVDSLETWGMMLSGVPSPGAFIDMNLLAMSQSIDRLGLVLKNVQVTPKIWRAAYQPRKNRTDPKLPVEDRGLLTTNYTDDELTTIEGVGPRLYVPGTACGADMYMIFYTYGTVGNAPLHLLYGEIAAYVRDLYSLGHEELEEMSSDGGIDVLLKTARAGFSSIKDTQEVARIDAIGAELMFRKGDCIKALKHAMSISGDSYNLERQVAQRAVEQLCFSVEQLATNNEFEDANDFMARLLKEFPYVTEFHALQVRLIKTMIQKGEFAMAYDIVPLLKKYRHVQVFRDLQDMIETEEAAAEEARLAAEAAAEQARKEAEEEMSAEARRILVKGYPEARKELEEYINRGDVSEAVLRAENMLPRFAHSEDCTKELQDWIKAANGALEDSEVASAQQSTEALTQGIKEGLAGSPIADKLADKLLATQKSMSAANDQQREAESEAPEEELIERGVLPDGRVTAPPITAEVAEAIASEAEEAEAEEATG